MRSVTRVIATLLLACVLAGCTGASTADVDTASAQPTPVASGPPIAPSEGFATTRLVLTEGDDRVELTAWVADTRSLRRRGLMERTDLPDDAGMLFVFDAPTRNGFWMKDTRIPLSIAFFDDDGRLLETLDMPPCRADPCPLYSPGITYRYALEVNEGFYATRGITADWSLDIGGALGAS